MHSILFAPADAECRTAVLIIDEAQNLEPSVLEQIRLISNLETDSEKLIQIVWVGQPELLQILNRKEGIADFRAMENTCREIMEKYRRFQANIPSMVYLFALHPDGGAILFPT